MLEYVVIKWLMSLGLTVSEISKRRSVRSSISWFILCNLWPDLSKCLPHPGMPPDRDSILLTWNQQNTDYTPLNPDKLVKASSHLTVQRLYSVWRPVSRHSDTRKVLSSSFKLLEQKHSQSTCSLALNQKIMEQYLLSEPGWHAQCCCTKRVLCPKCMTLRIWKMHSCDWGWDDKI